MAQVEADPLYLAMTRPPMIFGAPLLFAGAALLSCCMVFIWTKLFSALLCYPLIHLAGVVMVNKDPRFMEIARTWATKCSQCRSRRVFGTNVYFG